MILVTELVSYLWMKRCEENVLKSLICFFFSDGSQLAEISKWIEEGKVKPLIDSTYDSLEKIPEALTYFESGASTGKVVVNVSGPKSEPEEGGGKEEV